MLKWNILVDCPSAVYNYCSKKAIIWLKGLKHYKNNFQHYVLNATFNLAWFLLDWYQLFRMLMQKHDLIFWPNYEPQINSIHSSNPSWTMNSNVFLLKINIFPLEKQKCFKFKIYWLMTNNTQNVYKNFVYQMPILIDSIIQFFSSVKLTETLPE